MPRDLGCLLRPKRLLQLEEHLQMIISWEWLLLFLGATSILYKNQVNKLIHSVLLTVLLNILLHCVILYCEMEWIWPYSCKKIFTCFNRFSFPRCCLESCSRLVVQPEGEICAHLWYVSQEIGKDIPKLQACSACCRSRPCWQVYIVDEEEIGNWKLSHPKVGTLVNLHSGHVQSCHSFFPGEKVIYTFSLRINVPGLFFKSITDTVVPEAQTALISVLFSDVEMQSILKLNNSERSSTAKQITSGKKKEAKTMCMYERDMFPTILEISYLEEIRQALLFEPQRKEAMEKIEQHLKIIWKEKESKRQSSISKHARLAFHSRKIHLSIKDTNTK